MVIAELETLLFFPFDPTRPPAPGSLDHPSPDNPEDFAYRLMVLIGTTDSRRRQFRCPAVLTTVVGARLQEDWSRFGAQRSPSLRVAQFWLMNRFDRGEFEAVVRTICDECSPALIGALLPIASAEQCRGSSTTATTNTSTPRTASHTHADAHNCRSALA